MTSTGGPDLDAPSGEAADPERAAAERRTGTIAGVAAYSLWGLFPLVFHQLEAVGAGEILIHRIVWSFVVVLVILWFRRHRQQGAIVWLREHPGAFGRLVAAGGFIAVNWLVYIWAVNHDHVVEAALGYYINPLITVALGIFVLGEHLRRLQAFALVFGVAAVAVLTAAYGRLPWVALVLACSFAGYGFLKKAVSAPTSTSLAIETGALLPFALVAMVVLEVNGDAAFGHTSVKENVLLVSLGVVTAVPLLLFGTAASRIPLSMLGLLQYLTPTLQLVCGVLILGEPLPPERLAGFVLVWVALILLGVDAIRASRAPVAIDEPEGVPLIDPV
ncbi:MAG: EamA family transporter RarD [Acidimicrobiales bacterium]|nr:EamA family transporter RarD [Acidimicrobiales bacterium]